MTEWRHREAISQSTGRGKGFCWWCVSTGTPDRSWPCDAQRMLDEVERLREALRALIESTTMLTATAMTDSHLHLDKPTLVAVADDIVAARIALEEN